MATTINEELKAILEENGLKDINLEEAKENN